MTTNLLHDQVTFYFAMLVVVQINEGHKPTYELMISILWQ